MMLLLNYKMHYPAKLNKKSVTAVTMMLKSAKETHEEAMDQLEKIRKKQKSQNKTAYYLLDQALPSSEMLQVCQ